MLPAKCALFSVCALNGKRLFCSFLRTLSRRLRLAFKSLLRLPIYVIFLYSRLSWNFAWLSKALRGSTLTPSSPNHHLVISGGFWFRENPCNPFSSYYFELYERSLITSTLLASNGSQACISSYSLESGWLLKTWSGLVVLGRDQSVCLQTSSGTGARFDVSPRHLLLSDCFVALQRNDHNYAHFLCEVACSLIAFRDFIVDLPTLAISQEFGVPILRLLGFPNQIRLVPNVSLVRVANVELFAMLPGGYVNPLLLAELRNTVVTSRLRSSDIPDSQDEVIFLDRLSSDTRQLTNSVDVIRLVRGRFPDLKVIRPGALSFDQQVASLVNAKIVISAQGAHAANLLWAHRLEHYIELTANGDGYVAAMATALGASVHQCIGSALCGPVPSYDYGKLLFSDHQASLDDLNFILRSI
jgi:hypothetical protein